MNITDLTELENRISYQFKNKNLLKQAMTHSSFSNEQRLNKLNNNERLEFLGDAVLELITSEFLYERYQTVPEGELTKLRASIVCEPTLAYCARELSLGEFLFLGKGEDNTGGRYRDSVVSDALEALIGSIYLDGGFANAKEFIIRFVLNDVENKQLFFDSKTILQEIIQSKDNRELSYVIVNEEGPDHNKRFEVNAVLAGDVIGTGTGRTKKGAEQEAAYQAIKKLKDGIICI